MSGKPTFGSLFSGIGGIDLGLERAGWECRWQVENDEFCTRVLEKHWPEVRRYGDVRRIDPRELEAVDLVCGGFPCQSVSTAGKRKGEDDPRWLWPEFRRFVGGLEPRWALAENVPGLFSVDSGRVFGGILRDLAEIGYDAEWDCVPAAAFGAPHLRYRVFILAYPYRAGRDNERLRFRQDSRIGEGAAGQFDQGRSPMADAEGGFARQPHRKSGGADIGPGSREVGGQADAEREIVADPDGERREDASGGHPEISVLGGGDPPPWGTWAVEPDVGRVADGVPSRVDRLRSLGNAVVPQVAEWLGRRIMECHLEIYGGS